jgi:hypothetical protein
MTLILRRVRWPDGKYSMDPQDYGVYENRLIGWIYRTNSIPPRAFYSAICDKPHLWVFLSHETPSLFGALVLCSAAASPAPNPCPAGLGSVIPGQSMAGPLPSH